MFWLFRVLIIVIFQMINTVASSVGQFVSHSDGLVAFFKCLLFCLLDLIL